MCSAWRFCLSEYDDLSPLGMLCSLCVGMPHVSQRTRTSGRRPRAMRVGRHFHGCISCPGPRREVAVRQLPTRRRITLRFKLSNMPEGDSVKRQKRQNIAAVAGPCSLVVGIVAGTGAYAALGSGTPALRARQGHPFDRQAQPEGARLLIVGDSTAKGTGASDPEYSLPGHCSSLRQPDAHGGQQGCERCVLRGHRPTARRG